MITLHTNNKIYGTNNHLTSHCGPHVFSRWCGTLSLVLQPAEQPSRSANLNSVVGWYKANAEGPCSFRFLIRDAKEIIHQSDMTYCLGRNRVNRDELVLDSLDHGLMCESGMDHLSVAYQPLSVALSPSIPISLSSGLLPPYYSS